MKSTLQLFGNTHSLKCISPIVADTNLLGVDLGGVVEILCEGLVKPFSTKVLDINLLMASTFLPAYPFPKLIQETIHMYNVSKGNILKKDGSVLLNLNTETISRLFHLEEQQFFDLTHALSIARFSEKVSVYRNTKAKSWTESFHKGGSRLPKTLNKSQMTTQVQDIMVLLHRIFGSPDVSFFEEWMYFYIQIVLKGSQFRDWVELIGSSLRDQLKGALNLKRDIFMSSYLMYMVATTQDLQSLPHEP